METVEVCKSGVTGSDLHFEKISKLQDGNLVRRPWVDTERPIKKLLQHSRNEMLLPLVSEVALERKNSIWYSFRNENYQNLVKNSVWKLRERKTRRIKPGFWFGHWYVGAPRTKKHREECFRKQSLARSPSSLRLRGSWIYVAVRWRKVYLLNQKHS